MFIPSQADIALINQKEKTLYTKIEILDENYLAVNCVEGQMITDSFTIDSSSPNRRTYNVDFYINDSSVDVGENRIFWFNRYIRPYVGFYSLRDETIKWYLKGTFAFSETNYVYEPAKKTLSITCLDLISLLNGDLGGRSDGLTFTISKGEDVRTSIIGILSSFKFNKYRIDIPGNASVPYDLEFSANTTAYEMISKIMEVLPSYEYFFDIDGTFVVQRRPCYTNDTPILTDAILNSLFISETYKQDFTNVKNCIQIWAHEFNTDNMRYSNSCIYHSTSNLYAAAFEGLDKLADYTILSIKIPETNKSGCSLKINNIGTFKVLTEYEKELTAGVLNKDTSYVFLYKNSNLYYLGQYQIQAVYKNEINESPFSIQNIVREIWEIKQGDEYSNIISDANALERAMYECYKASNTNESLTLDLIDIPWLDVNQKISYTLSKETTPYEWLVNNISGSTMEGNIRITCSRFFPDWSEKYIDYMN